MIELLSIPAIVAVVEAAKMAGLSSKYASVLAIVVGLGFGFLMSNLTAGLIFGLAASGLYSGVKAALNDV